jgi:hypothetical protein
VENNVENKVVEVNPKAKKLIIIKPKKKLIVVQEETA